MTSADKKVSEKKNNSILIVRQYERSLFSFIEEQIIALLTFQRQRNSNKMTIILKNSFILEVDWHYLGMTLSARIPSPLPLSILLSLNAHLAAKPNIFQSPDDGKIAFSARFYCCCYCHSGKKCTNFIATEFFLK